MKGETAFRRGLVLLLLGLVFSCTPGPTALISWRGSDAELAALRGRCLAAEGELASIELIYPYQGSLFPADIVAPRFIWQDQSGAKRWLITLMVKDGPQLFDQIVDDPAWQPVAEYWQQIKEASLEKPARFVVWGLNGDSQPLSRGEVGFATSSDPVGAPIFFRQVPLPFSTDNFEKMRWLLGSVSEPGPPKVVMEGLPVCASCHAFSRDGRTMSMELNLDGDSGAQFVKQVAPEMVLRQDDFMSWNDFPKSGVLPESRGLFGRMSPSGRYLVASVNEISLAIITHDLAFSQVFFPTYGILASYGLDQRQIAPLPGADDYDYVHANPAWSPDEKYLVFCRAKTKNEVHEDISQVRPMVMEGSVEELNRRYQIQFDLYRLPFNNGQGGTPEPLVGASNNGYSNYFPRYSPDGRWLVFTRSRTGIMLQPDSELFIIPAEGGEARRMNCNRSLFNSWHSWSPNGHWLLFSSKAHSPYTELYLTHIDRDGNDSPPVRLDRFSSPTHAANVPEFANISFHALNSIRVQRYHE